MINMQDDIPEFRVFYAERKKERGLRAFIVRQKPFIQLVCLHKSKSIDIDISLAAKCFIPISTDALFRFKILLKDNQHSHSFRTKDKKIFEDCVRRINYILETYHKTRESSNSRSDSVRTPSSNERASSRSTSSGYEGGAIKRESQTQIFPYNENIQLRMGYPRRATISTEYLSMQSSTSNEDKIFKNDTVYEIVEDPVTITKINPLNINIESYCNLVDLAKNQNDIFPQFNINTKPLQGPLTEITEFHNIVIPADMDPNIRGVLKLKKEMQSSGGLEFKINNELLCCIEVAEIDKELWISKVKDTGNLRQLLHVGDKIWKVDKEFVNKKVEFIQFAKREEVLLRIQRLPMAKVFVIENDLLKKSVEKRISDKSMIFKIKGSQKNPWIITEINKNINISKEVIEIITTPPDQFHALVLHTSSFINKLKHLRKFSV